MAIGKVKNGILRMKSLTFFFIVDNHAIDLTPVGELFFSDSMPYVMYDSALFSGNPEPQYRTAQKHERQQKTYRATP